MDSSKLRIWKFWLFLFCFAPLHFTELYNTLWKTSIKPSVAKSHQLEVCICNEYWLFVKPWYLDEANSRIFLQKHDFYTCSVVHILPLMIFASFFQRIIQLQFPLNRFSTMSRPSRRKSDLSFPFPFPHFPLFPLENFFITVAVDTNRQVFLSLKVRATNRDWPSARGNTKPST